MKILWLTNIPSPYRVDFFNELGKYCELTVLFERETSADYYAGYGSEDGHVVVSDSDSVFEETAI